MPNCSAFNCSYRHFKNSGKSVHRFPFNRPDVLEQWVNNMRRDDWSPTKSSVLCSDHFEPVCFNRNGPVVMLKPNAVPTKF